MLRTQSESGAWRAEPTAWGQDRKPIIGMRMGQMDGANTYLTTLALIDYLEAEFRPPAAASP